MQTKLWHTGNLGPYMAEAIYCEDKAFDRSGIWSFVSINQLHTHIYHIYVYKHMFTLMYVDIPYTENVCCEQTHVFHTCKQSPYYKKGNLLYRSKRSVRNWMYFVQVYSLKGARCWRTIIWSAQEQIYGKLYTTSPLLSICLKDWCKTYNIQIWPQSQI